MNENIKQKMNRDTVAYLLSFLAILVARAGGTLLIKGLSDYSNTNLQLRMNLDTNNDSVTLTVSSSESAPMGRDHVQ